MFCTRLEQTATHTTTTVQYTWKVLHGPVQSFILNVVKLEHGRALKLKSYINYQRILFCPIFKASEFFFSVRNLKASEIFTDLIALFRKLTVDSRLFETALIRIIRLFEVRWHPPWICLLNSGKNTLGYSNFSYSNFLLFEAISIPHGANYRLNCPQLFEFFLWGDYRVRALIS